MNRRYFLRSAVAAGIASTVPTRALLAQMAEVRDDIEALTGDSRSISIEQAAIDELAGSLRGNLLMPGNAGYDAARRVLNETIDKHPALIVQPTGVGDIQNAVTFARERDLLLAVKCGGHSYGGKSTCEGGMQIDLSTFRHARVDRQSKTIHVAGGSLLGEMDHESMAHGLVTPAGTVSHTGVGGLTLGGGFGRVARRWGLSLDNVRSMQVVTADGELVFASGDENPDLYWGLRGGGGNFGVVTNFEFDLYPMQRTVVAGEIMYPVTRFREMLDIYSEYAFTAADELYLDPMAVVTPSVDQNVAMFIVCYSGDPAKADEMLAPLRQLGPVVDTVKTWDYVALQQAYDNTEPRNIGQYLKGGFVNEVPDAMCDEIVQRLEPVPGGSTMVYFQHSGGAIGRVATDETAFAHRNAIANMFFIGSYPRDADPELHFDNIRSLYNAVDRYTDGWYTNEVSNEPQRIQHSNYQGNFDRLLALKNKYDPGNLFRLNANIDPA